MLNKSNLLKLPTFECFSFFYFFAFYDPGFDNKKKNLKNFKR